jgi:uncharacterized repeat protein (TIGR03943 family)
MTVASHAARVTALASWAVFSAVIWLGGDADRFLSERTTWVVPFGAVVTGAAALLLLARGRPAASAPLSSREALGLLAILAPIVAVLAVPGAEVGADAAERRLARGSARSAAPPVDPVSGVQYTHIMATYGHPQPGVEEGVRVRLVGFTMVRDGTPPGMFQVTRFELSCCVADATPLFVTVDPRGPVPPQDAWVVVTGELEPRVGGFPQEGRFLVGDADVQRIPPPEMPYLTNGRELSAPSVKHGTQPPDPTLER